MQAFRILLFSTFVAFTLIFGALSARAEKETASPDLGPAVPDAPPPARQTNPVDQATLDLGPATPAPKNIPLSEGPGYFHADHNSFTLLAGAVANSSPQSISGRSNYAPAFAGLRLLGTTDRGAALEGGVDIMSDGTGELSFARRWIDGQDSFRPYLKLGIGLWVNAEDQLAALVEFEHFRMLGAVGFETHITGHSSLRLEIEGGLGWPSIHPFPSQATADIGWVMGW